MPSEGFLKVLAGFPNQNHSDRSCGDLVEWGKGTSKSLPPGLKAFLEMSSNERAPSRNLTSTTLPKGNFVTVPKEAEPKTQEYSRPRPYGQPRPD